MSDNRGLMVAVVVTGVLVAAAAAIQTGAIGSGGAAPTPASPGGVSPVLPVVTRSGAASVPMEGPVRVELTPANATDNVELQCGTFRQALAPNKAGKVAFQGLPKTTCAVKFRGADRAYAPVYPGDSLTCMWLNGATTCGGGVATRMPGRVSVDSGAGGSLYVDGKPLGELPLVDLSFEPGKHELKVVLGPEAELTWPLVVSPGESIHLEFPVPTGYVAQK